MNINFTPNLRLPAGSTEEDLQVLCSFSPEVILLLI